MTLRILVADDQALLRSTFRLLIDSAPDMTVVAEAGTGDQAIELAHTEHPDIILMDIRMPGLDGIAATRAITADHGLRNVKIIILTTFETEELVVDALRAGASGYLGKGIEPGALLDSIRVVSGGEALLSPAATRALISTVLAQPSAGQARPTAALAELTPRELEILTLVGLGLANDDIARKLFISPTTAKTHVNRTMMKLHARDRAQLVIAAYESGLVTPGQQPDGPASARSRPS
jgi:DNA-binding NarL/FixJ family response regulator